MRRPLLHNNNKEREEYRCFLVSMSPLIHSCEFALSSRSPICMEEENAEFPSRRGGGEKVSLDERKVEDGIHSAPLSSSLHLLKYRRGLFHSSQEKSLYLPAFHVVYLFTRRKTIRPMGRRGHGDGVSAGFGVFLNLNGMDFVSGKIVGSSYRRGR